MLVDSGSVRFVMSFYHKLPKVVEMIRFNNVYPLSYFNKKCRTVASNVVRKDGRKHMYTVFNKKIFF